MQRIFLLLFAFPFCFLAQGQTVDSIINKLTGYVDAVDAFSKSFPQEKVYLHFDNTSYYRGDHIWFKCYVVTSAVNKASELSKTLYVDLLNPGGEVIDTRILKIENGQCHGEFTLNQVLFYSGFYEVRAYTKYMLNFGEDVIFSRLLPVFERPKTEGDYTQKDMQKYGTGNYPMMRDKLRKAKKVNIKFFPEGGNLVEGVESSVAFEATDEFGNPIEITGTVIDEQKEELSRFTTVHNGRGLFMYTPVAGKQKAVVIHQDKDYQFDMPIPLQQGIVMKVDNLSNPDSLTVLLSKNKNTLDDIVGVLIMSREVPQTLRLVRMTGTKKLTIGINKKELSPGVSRIIVFDKEGKFLGDRLVFVGGSERLNISIHPEKREYKPHEPVNLEFTISDKDKNPVSTTFSLAVREGMDEVEYHRNIMTDLLLMSEIKGYVDNPSYYFEADDHTHRSALDVLLMVQGWRRYNWKQMSGTAPFDLTHAPEQGIERKGEVVSFVRMIPKPNVDLSFMLTQRGEDTSASFVEPLTTDSLGRFYLSMDVYGKWDMILAASVKGKKKDYRILFDRLFSPSPRKYMFPEMLLSISTNKQEEETNQEEKEPYTDGWEEDSIHRAMDEKVHRLKEVTVTAKKRTKERDIYEGRSKSIAYYDVHSELDDITDSGKYIGNDMDEFLLSVNKDFYRKKLFLAYKGKSPLFVINYKRTTVYERVHYRLLNVEAIKSVYINESPSAIVRYADPTLLPQDVLKVYSCVVFIETYPEGMIPVKAGKGVRKTKLEGYSLQKEFYSPDYSKLPLEADYRRTLYWNPSVTSDENGKAEVQFYNNSRCRNFSFSVETITPQGATGVYGHIDPF